MQSAQQASRGQALVEYALILCVLAVVFIAGLRAWRDALENRLLLLSLFSALPFP